MKKRTKILIGVLALALATIAGTGVAISNDDDDGTETAIPAGTEYDAATTAALAHLGEGTVTETEKGDEESLYEVEVTLEDGTQVDVQLDADFNVVGTEADDPNDED